MPGLAQQPFPPHVSAMIKSDNHNQTAADLSGKLLIAMPGMGDPRFEKSVVYICAHGDEGAMGLIINKPTPDLMFADLLEQLGIPQGDAAGPSGGQPIHFGGPVETARGFVLHSSDYAIADATLTIDPVFAMTATRDILADMARGQGPVKSLLALGYAGWAPGQLEAELQQNGWLVTDAAPEIVFAEENGSKWKAALETLGIDPLMLSAAGGRA